MLVWELLLTFAETQPQHGLMNTPTAVMNRLTALTLLLLLFLGSPVFAQDQSSRTPRIHNKSALVFDSPTTSFGGVWGRAWEFGTVDLAESNRLRLTNDQGQIGWIGPTGWEFLSDPQQFVDYVMSPGAKKVTRNIRNNVRMQGNQWARELEREREEKERQRITDERRARELERENKVKEAEALAINTWTKLMKDRGIPLAILVVRDNPDALLGLLDPQIGVLNVGQKTVKYINFELHPFNPVGDPVVDRVSGKSMITVRAVGPLKTLETGTYDDFDTLFSSKTVSCIELHRVVIEFMDGTKYVMLNDLIEARMPKAQYKVKGECIADL